MIVAEGEAGERVLKIGMAEMVVRSQSVVHTFLGFD